VIRTHYSLEIRLFMFHDQEAVAIATKPLAKMLRKGQSSETQLAVRFLKQISLPTTIISS
jgi:hypothetical protein